MVWQLNSYCLGPVKGVGLWVSTSHQVAACTCVQREKAVSNNMIEFSTDVSRYPILGDKLWQVCPFEYASCCV